MLDRDGGALRPDTLKAVRVTMERQDDGGQKARLDGDEHGDGVRLGRV